MVRGWRQVVAGRRKASNLTIKTVSIRVIHVRLCRIRSNFAVGKRGSTSIRHRIGVSRVQSSDSDCSLPCYNEPV